MNKIRELRKSKHITQTELAAICNTTTSNVSGWECEKWQPDYKTLIKLADYFGVTVDYLLGRDGGTVSASVAPTGETLTASERELLAGFRQLSHGMQEVVLNTVRGLTGAGGSALQKKA